jgi:Rieske Fe-S protein
MSEDRRQALKMIGGMLGVIGASLTGYYAVTREGAIDEWVTVGPVADLPVGEIAMKRVSVTEHGLITSKSVDKVIWLRRTADEAVEVFSGACPHYNCTANWIPEKTLFDCRCHNSVFDPNGKVVSGPSPRPLDTLEHQVAQGVLSVRYQKFKKSIPQKVVVT